LALIWLIVQFSLPAPPAVPAGTKIANLNRVKLRPWAQGLGLTIAALALLAVILPHDAKFVVFAVGGLIVLLGLVMLFTVYIIALQLDRSLTSVESQPWVHWRYTPQEWKAWSAVEVARIEATTPRWQWQRDWKTFLISLVAVSLPFAVNFQPADWKWLTALTALSWLMIIGLVVGVDLYAKTAPYRMRRLLAHAPPDTYLGAVGMYSDGVYTEWKDMGNYLVTATVDEGDPRSLAFVFNKSVSGGGTIEVRRNVLIPAGADVDFARLQTALAAVCPAASISLA
jgi:hypothetical protein